MPDKRKIRNSTGVREESERPLHVDRKSVHKCAGCTRILFTGDLGKGTHIEAMCKHCGFFTQIHKP